MNKKVQNPLFIAGRVAGAFVLCLWAILFFPDPFLNMFVKPGIESAFGPAYTVRIEDMSYSVMKNRFTFDSVVASAADSGLGGRIASFSVGGVDWMHLLWGGELKPDDFDGADVYAESILLNSAKSSYIIRCEHLAVSVPDSQLTMNALKVHPAADDDQFFEESGFRQTRFRLFAPHSSAAGVDWIGVIKGTAYHMRSIRVLDATLDVRVNKDKPGATGGPSPLMPHDLLSSIGKALRVDHLAVLNGSAMYSESLAPNVEPAVITFDSLQISAEGIASHGDPGSAMILRAQGILANAGKADVVISIPSAAPEFSLRYSGSLSRMDLSALNSFLEPVEFMRIKEGDLQEATFHIDVVSGRALGSLRGIYKDLTIASIDKKTGSEKGLSDKLTSFIADNFKIHGTNVPDQPESFKIGKVKYVRKHDDTFIQFVWYALRTGVQDVVGF